MDLVSEPKCLKLYSLSSSRLLMKITLFFQSISVSFSSFSLFSISFFKVLAHSSQFSPCWEKWFSSSKKDEIFGWFLNVCFTKRNLSFGVISFTKRELDVSRSSASSEYEMTTYSLSTIPLALWMKFTCPMWSGKNFPIIIPIFFINFFLSNNIIAWLDLFNNFFYKRLRLFALEHLFIYR